MVVVTRHRNVENEADANQHKSLRLNQVPTRYSIFTILNPYTSVVV